MYNINLKSTKSSLLEWFDLFGVPITIRYNQKEKHQTRFGATLSLAIIIILLIQLYEVVYDVITYKNYSIIFQENIVEIPKKYDVNPSSFTFVFGLQDINLKQILNEQIYSVEGRHMSTFKRYNNTSLQYEYVTEEIAFKPEPCTEQHFQVEGAIEYFKKLPYRSLYCLPLGFNMTLEGQFGADEYKRFRLVIKYCKGDSCLAPEKIQETLKYCNLQVYYVNKAVQFTDRQNPFKSFGQSIFWQSGYSIMKNVNIYFRNSYLESDEGIFSKETINHSSLSYSFEREQVVNQIDQKMFDVFVNLEKNKESQYYRKYQRLSQGLSQLGGLFNFLFSLGCLICHPISRLMLQHKLLNSVFSFQNRKSQQAPPKELLNNNTQELQQLNTQQYNFTSPIQMTESKILETQGDEKILETQGDEKNLKKGNNEKNTLDFNNLKDADLKDNTESHNQNIEQKSIFNLNLFRRQPAKNQLIIQQENEKNQTKGDLTKTIFDFNTEPIEEEIDEGSDKKYRKKRTITKKSTKLITKLENELNQNVFQTRVDKIKLKIKEVFLSVINMKLSFLPYVKPTPKSKMISYSFQNLNNHIDISQIITKLLEIEKLKQLLLNEDQVKLFEFIPQPNMNEEEFTSENELLLQNSRMYNSGVLYYDRRNVNEKAYDAQLAFNRIFNNSIENISNIDKKLLTLLDPKVQSIFSQAANQIPINIQQSTSGAKQKNTLLKRESFAIFKMSPQDKIQIKKQLNFNLSESKYDQENIFGHRQNTNCDKDAEQLPV